MSKLLIGGQVNGVVGRISKGEYCLATKYDDGEAWDQWAVGFYQNEIFPGRHQIVDNEGMLFRGNGFRRCEPISREQGDYLIKNKDNFDNTGFNLWDYIHQTNPERSADARDGRSAESRCSTAGDV